MAYKAVKKEAPGRGKVDILAETYEPGQPRGEEAGGWRGRNWKAGTKNSNI